MQDKYKRLTKVQVELWLADPVTKHYLMGLDFLLEEFKDLLSDRSLISSDNNDLSMNKIHSALGTVYGLEQAAQPEGILNGSGLIEDEEKDEEGAN